MVVLSQTNAKYDVIPLDVIDIEPLIDVWEKSNKFTHWCNPWSLKALANANTYVLRMFEDEKLISYFPFEIKKFLNLKIIRPANYDLTLDFIDLCYVEGFEKQIEKLFIDWLQQQKGIAVDIFMCAENSFIAELAKKNDMFLTQNQGVYYLAKLKNSLDEFIMGLSRSPRSDMRKVLKNFDGVLKYRVIGQGSTKQDYKEAFEKLVELHKNVFNTDSAFLPHMEKMKLFVINSFDKNTFMFMQALDGDEVIATNLLAVSKKSVGLIQMGRSKDQKYSKIGTWILAETFDWAIKNKIKKFEYFFGDQEYKRRFSNSKQDALSISYFSTRSSKNKYRIFQRLGKYFKSLR